MHNEGLLPLHFAAISTPLQTLLTNLAAILHRIVLTTEHRRL